MAKNATQGTETFRGRVTARAVDGNHDPDIRNPHCAQAIDGRVAFVNAWWEVDLGSISQILISLSVVLHALDGQVRLRHTQADTHAHTHTHTHTHCIHIYNTHNEPPSLTWINIKPSRDKSTYVQKCYNGCTLKFKNR